jgi:hypothetical protein
MSVLGEYTHFDYEVMYKYIFPDLPDAEGRKYIAEMETLSSACWHEVLTYPGHHFIPTTCIVPNNDMVIETLIQRENIARAQSEGAKITVHDLNAGYVPLLTVVCREGCGDFDQCCDVELKTVSEFFL